MRGRPVRTMDFPAKMSPLASQLALQIAELVRDGTLQAGMKLREEALAQRLGVSRSPVRDALTGLAELGVVTRHPNRGAFVAPQSGAVDSAIQLLLRETESEPYRQIAARRLAGELPAQFTEAELGRWFDLTRQQVNGVVGRMAQEGWIEPRPGYGWSFVPILTTPDALERSYRFRQVLEPAALLQPGFRIEPGDLARFRAQQEAIVSGGARGLDPVDLFRLGSSFHEMLMRSSGNPFFLDAIQRVNRLRRLIEYRAMVDPRRFVPRAIEHLEILDLLEKGDRQGASQALARHLDEVRAFKLNVLETA
jgi:DNA-binding GntR family transcriptional regulator